MPRNYLRKFSCCHFSPLAATGTLYHNSPMDVQSTALGIPQIHCGTCRATIQGFSTPRTESPATFANSFCVAHGLDNRCFKIFSTPFSTLFSLPYSLLLVSLSVRLVWLTCRVLLVWSTCTVRLTFSAHSDSFSACFTSFSACSLLFYELSNNRFELRQNATAHELLIMLQSVLQAAYSPTCPA